MHTEVVAQRAPHRVGGVHTPCRDPPAERLGVEVDEDNLARAHELVGHRLDQARAGHPGCVVAQRQQVGHVHRGYHRNPDPQQLGGVFPALARAVDVGVCEFVDQYDVGTGGDDCVDVELLKPHSLVVDGTGRHGLQVAHLPLGLDPAVVFDPSDHDALAVAQQRWSRVRNRTTRVRKALGSTAKRAAWRLMWDERFPVLEVCGARCRPGGADDRGLRGTGSGPASVGAVASAENAIGLVLAVLLTGYLVVALLFPERF